MLTAVSIQKPRAREQNRRMRSINLLVIHCSASPNDRTLFEGTAGQPGFANPAQVIDRWHRERNFKRDPEWRKRQEPGLAAIGYHFVIARNGAVLSGRHIDEVGAHAQGWNRTSIGICLVGTDQFTEYQVAALRDLLSLLSDRHDIPLAPPEFKVVGKSGTVIKPGVCGHRDLPGHHKACPGFDVHDWLKVVA